MSDLCEHKWYAKVLGRECPFCEAGRLRAALKTRDAEIERLEAENARLERHISGLLIQNGEMAAEAIKEKSDD